MKVKFEPNEFEVGKKYDGKIIEIEPIVTTPLLQRAEGYNEVFVVKKEENIKQWVMNPETFEHREYDWNKIEIVSLSELKKYPVGESLNDFGVSENPPDIYYPEAEKPYPFKGLRGLLTLGPVPSGQLAKDLGFNAMMPYAGNVDWTGDYISIGKDRPGKVILRFLGDESDCRKMNPDSVYQEYLRMKEETPDIPVGLNLCDDIGCGVKGTCDSIEEYQKKWIEIANKVDYVSLNNYPYRNDWPDPVAEMERFYHFWKGNLTVPIIPVIQAHWVTDGLTKPDPMTEIQFWFGKGLTAFVAYCWKDENKGVVDMQQEWKNANLWAKNNL